MLHHSSRNRRQSGTTTPLALLLLLVMAGAGAWNYQRNLALERETAGARPYVGYSTADLRALRSAYSSEFDRSRAELESAQRGRVRPLGDRGSLAGNVAQFRETTRQSRQIRAAAESVRERSEEIEALGRELALRSDHTRSLLLHLKRLTTI